MIEDDAALARSIAALLRAGGHAVDHVATGEDALAVVGGEPYALVILDVGNRQSLFRRHRQPRTGREVPSAHRRDSPTTCARLPPA